MTNYSSSATYSPWGTMALAPGQSTVLRQTYMLLALCAGAGLVGGYVGATSPLMVGIFSTWLGWIVALLVINILPRVAISYRNSGSIGVAVLMADGFVSGLVLAPILALAAYRSPDIILS